MGVDNECKSGFGLILDEEDFKKLSKLMGFDILRDLWETGGERFDAFVEGLEGESNEDTMCVYTDYASPWYDADGEDLTIFVGIGHKGVTEYTMEDLTRLLQEWDNSLYRRILEEASIPFKEPILFCLPHIC